MPFAMDVQLDVDGTRGGLAELAYGWIEHLTTAMPASAGEIAVTRFPAPLAERRELSGAGLAWLRAELERELPTKVYLGAGPDLMAAVQTHRDSPGWVQLSAYPPDERFADPATQRRWLEALFAYADRVDPGYGQIDYHSGDGDTAIERRTRHVRGRPLLGECRQWLRGYSWVTIVPSELAGRIGGAAGLRDTGAFAEVKELTGGGVWLRATDTFAGWTLGAARPVFRALAPILRPGAPLDIPTSLGEPPLVLVLENPAGG
jgi:hypothetical protein